MRCLLAALCAGLSVSGCTGLDPSKLIPTAASTFQTAIGNTTAMEAKLIAAWQAENKSLLYLSADEYSCGDPKSLLYRKYASSKNPSTLVTQDQVDKYWTSSLKYLTAYLALLKSISSGAQGDQATIKQIVSVGSTAAGYIPGISSSAATLALTALGALASDLRGLVAVEQISAAARSAQMPLATAIKYLKQYYPKFLGNEQVAFDAWDECANERLLFIRDQPLGRIPSYRRAYFVTANGFDLDNAYQAYLAQRQSFIVDGSAQSIDKTLDQVLAENAKLADPGLTWETFQSSAQSLSTLYTDLSNAASAVQKFGAPAKPIAVPKTASTHPQPNISGTPIVVALEN
jgi:hypothetical protein